MPTGLKIAHVTPVYPPYRGGMGSVVAEYARRMWALGEYATVVTPDYHGGKRKDEYVVRVHPFFRWGNAAVVPKLFWELRKFDVIHLHYPFYGSDVIVVLASIVWRIPLVATYHMKTRASGFLGLLFLAHRAVFEHWIFKHIKTMFVSTLDYAKSVQVHHHDLRELPFGVDTVRFSPGADPTFREKYRLGIDEVVILFVGGLDRAHYFKGVECLLRAAVRLKSYSGWQLVIIGDGDRRERYERRVLQYELTEQVQFLGSINHQDLPRAYRAADLHVLPSINGAEAFGLVTIEAAASGIPSIVSDLPGMRSIVIHGKTGLWCPPDDGLALSEALRYLIQQTEQRQAMGRAARERALEKYDSMTCVQHLLEVYQQL